MAVIHQVSLLNSKAIKKINPKNIGWVRPDGIINFATKDAAKDYAINRCKSANTAPKKFERLVIVKDNMVLSEADGKIDNVNFDYEKISNYEGCDSYHNHPAPMPLSWSDYGVLVSQKSLKSITAIDIINRYYTMTKLPYKKIIFLPQKASNFINRQIFDRLHIFKAGKNYDNVSDKYKDKINQLNKELNINLQTQSVENFKKSTLSKTIKETFMKWAIDIDKMWSENAESLGVKYEHGKI